MDFIIVGLNHKTAPIELREKLSFSEEDLNTSLKELVSSNNIQECFILSTCNRVEVYAVTAGKDSGIQNIEDFLSKHFNLQSKEIGPYLYSYDDLQAMQHLFRVTSSLDSMVVGEPQITGQVKKAFEQAVVSGTTGSNLSRLIGHALYVSKRVRNETGISSRMVSVGSVSVDLAGRIFGKFEEKRVCLIGAGEIGELVLTSLMDKGVGDVVILNRTLEKARELVEKWKGESRSLDDLWDVLLKADVVITSIEGDVPLISKDRVAGLMQTRKNNPLFFIDLGVPRNIDSKVGTVNNVYLYNIDDLKSVADFNKGAREAEAKKGEEIVVKEASQFYESLLQTHPTIAQLGKKFDNIRRRELEKTLKKLSHLSEEDVKKLKKCTEAIVGRILHDPIITLKSEWEGKEESQAHRILRKFFRLDDE